MAVDVIAPDARKKVDELFLYWLSEPSTQDLLRQELARVCGMQQQRFDLYGAGGALYRPRPSSPTVRDVTPPPVPTNSPSRSPRNSKLVLFEADTPEKKPDSLAQKQEIDRESHPNGSVLRIPGTKTEAEVTPSVPADIPPSQHQTPAPKPVCIPPFYFPKGKANIQKDARSLQRAEKVFQKHLHQEVPRKEFHTIVKALGLPFYWRAPLFKACCTGKNKRAVSLTGFKKAWSKITDQSHSEASRFVNILLFNKKRDYLIEDDFEPLVQDVVDHHPGLEFLRDAPEFHTRYVETVISRIFYCIDRTWKGRLRLNDIQNSNLLETLVQLEKEDDINKVTDYFSYEHFYVIYCKFWELDTDHDLYISSEDLARHCDHALNKTVVDRLFSGVVTRDSKTPKGQMSYKDFVWFLLSEEDKTTCRSMEYWFRVLDNDGDGLLSLYELECFYSDVLNRLEEMNIESLSVENTVCQLLDMIKPKEPGRIALSDLKKSKLTPPFLNTFVNIEKYLDYEQKESTPLKDDEEDDTATVSDWERYASVQYELLVAEEQCQDLEENEEDDQLQPMDTTDMKDYLTVPQTV